MRVLHVTTLLDPAGSFGGPVRVAVNLAHELDRRGVEVALAAGVRNFPQALSTYEGVEAITARAYSLLPGAGFSGFVSPGLCRALVTRLRTFDVVHVHLSRDLVTLPAAVLAMTLRVPLVVQTHGMIDPSDRALALPLDLLATRRVLRNAGALLYLTPLEQDGLRTVAGTPDLRTVELPNGVPTFDGSASTEDDGTVVFASRLQSRKRPGVFVQAAAEVVRTRPTARFVVAGPDEGQLQAVRQLVDELGIAQVLSTVGALSHVELLDRLRRAAVYVLPSVDEPYPMTVLEAMSVGTPVIVTDSCGLAPAVLAAGAGAVVDPSVESLARAIGALLDDPARRRKAGEAAAQYARDRLGIAGVVDRLVATYDDVTERNVTLKRSTRAAR